jgi:Protein of unknown function (DUF3987)
VSETYLQTFTRYLKTRTDAPEDFHLHAGLCSLAVALGNRVWCDGYARDIYPNLHCVILASSGMGKSVPLDMAGIVLGKAGLGDHVLPSSFSREAIIGQLATRPVGIFILQEFAAFMALLARDYNHGAVEDLTDLYDGSDLVRKLTKETVAVRSPAVTLLGASSPEWFAQAFSGKNLRGGYLARFLFCPSGAAGDPIGDPGPRDEGTEAALALYLRDAAELTGKMDFRACRDRFNSFAAERRLRAREADPDIAGMRSRAPLMARKVAMLFHVSRELDLHVTDHDMEQAIKFVQATHDQAEKYLLEDVPRDKKDAERMRILEIVRARGGLCSWSTALKNSHMDTRDFRSAVETLTDSGQLDQDKSGRTRVLTVAKIRRDFAKVRESSQELTDYENGRLAALA